MKAANRDLLVLSKRSLRNRKEMELEVEQLHKLLLHIESLENFCIANEIVDINRYKIIQDPIKISNLITQKKIKAFQFISNKN
jgi:hypothetical protein